MDLEIADYERTVHTLNEQVRDKDTRIMSMETEISRQEEKVSALNKQLGELSLCSIATSLVSYLCVGLP